MGITAVGRRALGLGTASLLVVACASACGGSDTEVACAKILVELNSISTQVAAKGSDVPAMKAVYDDGAARLRSIAQGTDIQDEAEQAAVAMKQLGEQLAGFVANSGATPPQVDTTSLLDAGAALRQACT